MTAASIAAIYAEAHALFTKLSELGGQHGWNQDVFGHRKACLHENGFSKLGPVDVADRVDCLFFRDAYEGIDLFHRFDMAANKQSPSQHMQRISRFAKCRP
ncbi:hypothetical protein ASD12_09430 [Mesorhizobium sp. Root102]|nr:hypothetical protein ASD12_09430 [Mesorhizobium sp. Root102]